MDPQNPIPMADEELVPEEEEEDDAERFPQFQIDLATNTGNHLIAASDTVNDLVDQAKYWLNTTDLGGQLRDSDVRKVTLQELDSDNGSYVDGLSYPVEDKKDIITKIRLMGAR